MKTRVVFLSTILYYASCMDFYTGMFKKNDFLVAQDTLYREKTPFRFTYAKYGRLFKCPITYIRVVDRLGVGRGPHVQITRGGLQKKFVTLRIVSMYNQPISVNIYIGCANNIQTTTITTITTTTPTTTTPTNITTTATSTTASTFTQNDTTPNDNAKKDEQAGEENNVDGETTVNQETTTTTPGGDE